MCCSKTRQRSRATPAGILSFCRACPLLASCTSSQTSTPRRLISVRPREQHEALQAARRREQTPAFAKQYAQREGIEATISQGVRAFDMRRSRYVGTNKTHLQHVSIAAAINLVRFVVWLDGDLPAPTRVTPFQKLCSVAQPVYQQCILKTSCTQANLNFFIRSGASPTHEVSNLDMSQIGCQKL